MIDLAMPLALLLLPLPLLVIRLLPAAPTGGAALAVPERIGQGILAGAGQRRAPVWRRRAAPWAVWVLLVLALAGPRQLEPIAALRVSGRDLAIVLDLSGSMVRDDFFLDGAPVTRLAAVQKVGASFARGRAGDRVALIVFGSDAYYAAPF
ncbi:MAG: VWA domain-containing protein, partial [Rhodobacterales bacterium]